MKTVKVLLSVVALMVTVSVMAAAPKNAKMTATQRAAQMTEQMTQELSLSKEQASKIQQIFVANFQEMEKNRAARGDMRPMPDSMKCKGPQQQDGMCPPQKRGQRGDRPVPDSVKGQGGPRQGGQFAKMDAQIKAVLTDAQYQKWTEQRAQMRAQHPQHPQHPAEQKSAQ